MKNNKLVIFISTLALFVIATFGLAQDSTSHESIVRQYIVEFWSRGNVEVAKDVLASKAVLLSPDGVFEGIAAIKSLHNIYSKAFSDLNFLVDDISVSDNKVKVKWLLKGTHDGEILGAVPTWQAVELKGTSLYVLEKDKIVKEIKDYNEQDFLEQLGVVLEPSEFEAVSTENTQTRGAIRYGR